MLHATQWSMELFYLSEFLSTRFSFLNDGKQIVIWEKNKLSLFI